MEVTMDVGQPDTGATELADSEIGSATGVDDGSGGGPAVDGGVGSDEAQLLSALATADSLPLDDRLDLLRRAEASIAGVLEGLDGL